MTTIYGKFEAVDQLFQSPNGAVWSARSLDTDEPAKACIKLVQLNEMMIEDRDTSVAQSLLVSAAIQQTMANKSEFWAPVYELGSDGTNAFFVSGLYPRSLQTVIETETNLTSAELKIIMLAIVDGLIDLETAYHRQHGNLKPSNVLLAARGHISPGGLLLADPDSVADNLPSITRAPDTKAMGQILYALVTHKPYTGARLPLQKSPAWKQLGASGNQWFALCERLLDTFSKQGLGALESVRYAIGDIRDTRRRFPRSIVAAIILAAAGAAAYAGRAHLAESWNSCRDAVTTQLAKFNQPAAQPMAVTPAKPTTNPAMVHPATPATQSTAVAVVHPPVIPPTIPSNQIIARPPTVPTQPAVPKENPVLGVIRSAVTPELHSTTAEQEFEHCRDLFLARRIATKSANIVEWNTVYRAVQAMDLTYPQPDPALPASLTTELTNRRDAELVKGIDAVFDQDNADPSGYTAELSDVSRTGAAATNAHNAIGSADLTAADTAVKDFTQKHQTLQSIDPDAASAFASSKDEFRTFVDAKTSTDRVALLIAAANDSLPLSVRLRSWLRLSKAGDSAWPADLATLAADRAQGDQLSELSKDVPATQTMIAAEQQARFDGFFASLRDETAAHDAAQQAATAQFTSLVPHYPQWFQYDVMLAKLQAVPAPAFTHEQTISFLDLADKLHISNAAQLRAAFAAVAQPARTLADSGPSAVTGWRLAPGSDRDHRTYFLGDESIEFLRVHQPAGSNGSAAIDCYLSTTEVPISLLMTTLDKNHAAQLQAAETLNDHPAPQQSAMRIWSFAPDGIQLDNQDYRACFLLSPTTHLPAQEVTPELAMYVARLVGCRLPTSDEWRGALKQVTQPTSDAEQWGFAMRNWKLRDSDFTNVMNHAANLHPPQYWPNENIFRDPTRLNPAMLGGDARIWSAASLATLAGQIAPVPNVNQPDGDQDLPMAASHLGFREVDDGAHFTGVFHDLIGNAAEWVIDIQPGEGEKLDISDPAHAVDQIKAWFNPDRQGCVAVIGGSALSSPDLDPRTAYKLPATAPTRAFSDVGFRLAFSDPRAAATVDPAKLRAAALHAADYVTSVDAQPPATQP